MVSVPVHAIYNVHRRFLMKKNLKSIPILFSLCTLLGACSAGSHPDIEKEKKYELGETVTILPKDFITEGQSDLDPENMTVESDLKTSPEFEYNGFRGEVKTAGKNYLGIGEYSLTLVDGNKKYPIKLVVEDTTAPNFIMVPSRRVVAAGATDQDVLKVFKAEDKDKADLSLEGDYDLNTPGEYQVTVVASDPSGNRQTKEITLVVRGDGDVITSDDTQDLNPEDFADSQPDQGDTSAVQTPDNSDDSTQSPSDDSSSGSSDNSTDSTVPDQNQTPDTSGSGSACPVSQAPAGSTVYTSFDQALAAGIAWNQQNPNNYFYYLQANDDCGNPVFLITMGTRSESDGV